MASTRMLEFRNPDVTRAKVQNLDRICSSLSPSSAMRPVTSSSLAMPSAPPKVKYEHSMKSDHHNGVMAMDVEDYSSLERQSKMASSIASSDNSNIKLPKPYRLLLKAQEQERNKMAAHYNYNRFDAKSNQCLQQQITISNHLFKGERLEQDLDDGNLQQSEPIDFSKKKGSTFSSAIANSDSAISDVTGRSIIRGAIPERNLERTIIELKRSKTQPKSAEMCEVKTAKVSPSTHYLGVTQQHHHYEERSSTNGYASPPLTSLSMAGHATPGSSRASRRGGAGRPPPEMDNTSEEEGNNYHRYNDNSQHHHHQLRTGSDSLLYQSRRNDYCERLVGAEEMDDDHSSEELYRDSPTGSHHQKATASSNMINQNQFGLTNPFGVLNVTPGSYGAGIEPSFTFGAGRSGHPAIDFLAATTINPSPMVDIHQHTKGAFKNYSGPTQSYQRSLSGYYGLPGVPQFPFISPDREYEFRRNIRLHQPSMMQMTARHNRYVSSPTGNSELTAPVAPLLTTVTRPRNECHSPASPSTNVDICYPKSPHRGDSSSRSSSSPPTNLSNSGAAGSHDEEAAERAASSASAPACTSSDSDAAANLDCATSDVMIATMDAHHLHQQQQHRHHRKNSSSFELYYSNNEDDSNALSPPLLNGGGGAPRGEGSLTNASSQSPHSSSSNDGMTSSRGGGSNKKRGRSLPDELKDGAYWERRRKNNEAAKRSRDARRAKEDEIAIRAAFLEQENLKLRVEVTSLKSETAKLRCLLLNS